MSKLFAVIFIAAILAGCAVVVPGTNVEACIACPSSQVKTMVLHNWSSCEVEIFQNGVRRMKLSPKAVGRIHLPPPIFDDRYQTIVFIAQGNCGADERHVSVGRHNLQAESWTIRPRSY